MEIQAQEIPIRRLLQVAGVVLLAMGSAEGQTAAAPSAFEVASIKPNRNDTGFYIGPGPNGSKLIARSVTVRRMIMRSYSLADWQITGAPDWIDNERYDIDAKPEHPVSFDQLLLMLKTLLADRFKLVMHSETTERAVYFLKVDKSGLKIKPHKDGDNDVERNNYNGAGHAVVNNLSMERLTPFLSVQSGRAVLDKTGIEGRYDFVLDFEPGRQAPDFSAPLPQLGTSSRPDLFTALKEQLGMKLEPGKGIVKLFHVDSVERPGEN